MYRYDYLTDEIMKTESYQKLCRDVLKKLNRILEYQIIAPEDGDITKIIPKCNIQVAIDRAFSLFDWIDPPLSVRDIEVIANNHHCVILIYSVILTEIIETYEHVSDEDTLDDVIDRLADNWDKFTPHKKDTISRLIAGENEDEEEY